MFGNAGLRVIVDLLIFLAAGVAGGIIGYLLMKSRQLQTRNEAEALLSERPGSSPNASWPRPRVGPKPLR